MSLPGLLLESRPRRHVHGAVGKSGDKPRKPGSRHQLPRHAVASRRQHTIFGTSTRFAIAIIHSVSTGIYLEVSAYRVGLLRLNPKGPILIRFSRGGCPCYTKTFAVFSTRS